MTRNIHIALDLTPGTARRIAIVATTLAVAGVAAVVHAAAVPIQNSFVDGKALTAKTLNDNFDAVEKRLAPIETGRVVVKKNSKQYSLGATYCGFTAPTTGAISSGALVGYAAVKDLCEKTAGCGSSPSAHMCTAQDLLLTTGLGISTIAGWYSGGLYITDAQNRVLYDCGGWTSQNAGEGGPAWNPAPNSPSALICSASTPVLCCD